MKNFNILFLFVLLGVNSFVFSNIDLAVCPNFDLEGSIENTVKDKFDFSKTHKENKKSNLKKIYFSFKDVDLVDVINIIAAEKCENIILPLGQDAIKSKLTIDIPEKLSLDEAWDILNTILDVAGYAMSIKGDMRKIVKKDDNLVKNAFRIFKEEQSSIFVDTDYKDIPETDERIIFLCYFDNIQVPQEATGGDGSNVIQEVIQIYTGKNVSSTSDRGTSSFRFIPGANGVVIVDKAINIRSMMKIFSELDKAGFKESLERIKLEHVSAETVANMFTDADKGIIGKKVKTTYRLGKKRKSKKNYFDKETKVVAEPKSNSLILMGNKEAIDRIKEFIYRFIDIPIEGGRSVLHRKKLDYLDCDKLREVLTKIVAQAPEEGTQARAGAQGSGPERFFSEGIQIETDRPKQDSGVDSDKGGQYKYSGTNSILVAAKNDDWKKIEELVEKLDRPLRQVIIEVLIVDLVMEGNRFLGSQTRNPSLAPLFNISQNGRPMNAQSAQLAPLQTSLCPEVCSSTSRTIAADLMENGVDSSGKSVNPFVSGDEGSTLLTISDKNGWTWSVLKALDKYSNVKILSHPYIVAINNKQATVSVGVEKLLQGDASGSSGGAVSVQIVPVKADIKVDVTPRIGGVDAEGNSSVNLQVSIDINEFQSTTVAVDQQGQNPQNIRKISTNANIKNNEILALGGLIRTDSKNSEGRAPILGSIPIIGWFFKARRSEKERRNLTVFIRATVVEPQNMGQMDVYTKDYINIAKNISKHGGLFDELKDPITRWFFDTEGAGVDRVDDFALINSKDISSEELRFAQSKFAQEKGSMLANNRPVRGMSRKDKYSFSKNVSNKNISSDVISSDLSCEDLSHINASNCDIAEIELKEGKDLSGQNTYELFEDGVRQDDLLVNASYPVNIDPVFQATKLMNSDIISTEGANVILAKNKEFNNSKNCNECACSKTDDKLRCLLKEIDNPFVAG